MPESTDVWRHCTATKSWTGPLESKRQQGARPDMRRRLREWMHVLVVLTRHEFRARYRAQALGVLWSLLQPLVTMALLAMIFSRVFQSATPNFPIFLLIGLVLWQWLSLSIGSSAQAFMGNSAMLKNSVFPRELLPIALVLSLTLNFLMEALLLVFFIPIFPAAFRLSPALLLLPVFGICFVALLVGAALVVSVLNVLYRDVAYIVTTGLLLLYWLTPVIYPTSVVPEPYQTALKCNPLCGLFNGVRNAIMLGEGPTLLGWAGIVVPTALTLLIGVVVFRRYERVVLDYV